MTSDEDDVGNEIDKVVLVALGDSGFVETLEAPKKIANTGGDENFILEIREDFHKVAHAQDIRDSVTATYVLCAHLIWENSTIYT